VGVVINEGTTGGTGVLKWQCKLIATFIVIFAATSLFTQSSEMSFKYQQSKNYFLAAF